MPQFSCKVCRKTFSLPPATLAKFPEWKPSTCMKCKKTSASREENLTKKEVLEKYHAGPTAGVFTDGSADPNPGPGGWGAVYVVDNEIIAEASGHEPDTTNNRMELMGIIAACKLVPKGTPTTLYSDSELCVNTFNVWVHKWKLLGWRRAKGAKGEIKNLELVQEVHKLLESRPEITLRWIKAHAGNRWNEYADALATEYRKK